MTPMTRAVSQCPCRGLFPALRALKALVVPTVLRVLTPHSPCLPATAVAPGGVPALALPPPRTKSELERDLVTGNIRPPADSEPVGVAGLLAYHSPRTRAAAMPVDSDRGTRVGLGTGEALTLHTSAHNRPLEPTIH